jgi:hypothetical protein
VGPSDNIGTVAVEDLNDLNDLNGRGALDFAWPPDSANELRVWIATP